LREALPDFRPTSLIDVGAGPATASFAAVEAFASLDELRLFDVNTRFRALAIQLMEAAESAALRNASYRLGDALALLREAATRPADLVIASYMAGEIPAGEIASIAKALWEATASVLVVIEPGTPAGYARVMAIRSELLAARLGDEAQDSARDAVQGHAQGGAQDCQDRAQSRAQDCVYVAAPCPHELSCPLTGADWCHFAQRLSRRRSHLQVKGVAVPYEDEKFSYVVLSRLAPARIDARVLAPPEITKAMITSKLCTPDGLVRDVAARRNGAAYRRRKDWRAGDAVTR
jgi:ribosomal protein RSM22 (predicted rRNA methylase)